MSVRYGTLTALADFDFVAADRSVTAVIGPNGSGKTTFLNTLTGAVPYQTGRVSILGDYIEKATPGVMHRAGLSRTFQNLDLMDDLSVEDNVRLGAACDSRATLIEAALGLPRSHTETRQRKANARATLEQLDIANLSRLAVSELSYGIAGASKWLAPWRARPGSCCSTSPPQAWVRTRAPSSRRWCCTSATSSA